MASGMSTVNALESKISAIAGNSMVQMGLLAGGFVVGVTQKDATFNAGKGYYSDPTWVAKDFLSRMGIGGITLKPGYVTTNEFAPNWGAIINKGTLVAAILAIANDNAPSGQMGRLVRLAHKVGFNFALGYGIGRVFDDPPSQSASSQYNQTTNLTRTTPGLVTNGAPWTG